MKDLKVILEELYNRKISIEKALDDLRFLPFKEISQDIKLDVYRELRTGQDEAVLGLGKTNAQLEKIIEFYQRDKRKVLVTKLDEPKGVFLKKRFPDGSFFKEAGLFVLNKNISLSPPWKETGDVVVVCAGSSDLKVGLEALGTLCFHDVPAGLICDVGVAGLHRLFPYLRNLTSSKVLIVVAGMEGALPSVVASMVDKPIVGVPTSVGYGTFLNGLSSLLTMLNTCAPGVCVVNIDNGFGAASVALKILRQLTT